MSHLVELSSLEAFINHLKDYPLSLIVKTWALRRLSVDLLVLPFWGFSFFSLAFLGWYFRALECLEGFRIFFFQHHLTLQTRKIELEYRKQNKLT